MEEQKSAQQQGISVNLNTYIGSQYAQIVGVTVTDTEITLEFVYKHPRGDLRLAQVVSRITLPREAAYGLAETIYRVKQQYEAKKRGKNE
jgi:hypothetical protein